MPNGERQKLNLEMAQALDDMTKTLSTENANFLERILKTLKEGTALRPKDEGRLEALYNRYFDENGEDGEEDEDEKESNGDDDIDEDDFV